VALRVAILLFDEVEVLDFAGPFEVFSIAGARSGAPSFNVETVALQDGPITARGGLKIIPTHTAAQLPPADILVVPGGYGTRPQLHNPAMIAFLQKHSAACQLTLSVCTGSLLLAKAGLLDGLGATTHAGAMSELTAMAGTFRVFPEARIVDSGHVVTSTGISAGIEMSLYMVARLVGVELADEAARFMHYDWHFRPADQMGIVVLSPAA